MALDLHKWIDEKLIEALTARASSLAHIEMLCELQRLLEESLNEQKNLASMGTGDAGSNQSVSQVDFCLTHPSSLMPCQYCSGTRDS